MGIILAIQAVIGTVFHAKYFGNLWVKGVRSRKIYIFYERHFCLGAGRPCQPKKYILKYKEHIQVILQLLEHYLYPFAQFRVILIYSLLLQREVLGKSKMIRLV